MSLKFAKKYKFKKKLEKIIYKRHKKRMKINIIGGQK